VAKLWAKKSLDNVTFPYFSTSCLAPWNKLGALPSPKTCSREPKMGNLGGPGGKWAGFRVDLRNQEKKNRMETTAANDHNMAAEAAFVVGRCFCFECS